MYASSPGTVEVKSAASLLDTPAQPTRNNEKLTPTSKTTFISRADPTTSIHFRLPSAAESTIKIKPTGVASGVASGAAVSSLVPAKRSLSIINHQTPIKVKVKTELVDEPDDELMIIDENCNPFPGPPQRKTPLPAQAAAANSESTANKRARSSLDSGYGDTSKELDANAMIMDELVLVKEEISDSEDEGQALVNMGSHSSRRGIHSVVNDKPVVNEVVNEIVNEIVTDEAIINDEGEDISEVSRSLQQLYLVRDVDSFH